MSFALSKHITVAVATAILLLADSAIAQVRHTPRLATQRVATSANAFPEPPVPDGVPEYVSMDDGDQPMVFDHELMGSGCETAGCESCGPLPCITCAPPNSHCASFHAGWLYLRARNADVSYAVPINGPIVGPPANNPIQVGGLGTVDPDYQSGYVAGLSYALSCDTSVAASYMGFESNTRNRVQTSAPNVIRSLVSHPSTASAATDFLQASANLGIDFDLADVAIRQAWFAHDCYSFSYVWGARYAKLEQQFFSQFVNNGVENVGTDIDFDGGGLRLGLEADRMSRHTRFGIYAKGAASFVAGRFRANYLQESNFDPVVVQTNWEAGRVVPILDVELGISWTSCSNHWHLRSGYVFSGWYNVAKTEDFIAGVQQNDFRSLDETLTFDGFLLQAELRF